MVINSFTICLHCGCSHDVVNEQIKALRPLESKYAVYWNNRIDRHPYSYDSYSHLVNHAIATSPTEWMILINDRTKPTVNEVEHILELLQSGYAAATKYSVGFIGYSKQLIRKIGWWDERYFGGGFDDDDFVLRLKLANLAYYESEESTYDKSWKSPLRPEGGDCLAKALPEFNKKWKATRTEIRRVIPESGISQFGGSLHCLGEERLDIEKTWKTWRHSKIGIMFQDRMKHNNGGQSRTKWFLRSDYKTEYRKVTSI